MEKDLFPGEGRLIPDGINRTMPKIRQTYSQPRKCLKRILKDPPEKSLGSCRPECSHYRRNTSRPTFISHEGVRVYGNCDARSRGLARLRTDESQGRIEKPNIEALHEVLRPAALASFFCRSSKVQKRCAFSSSAHVTCNVSSVRTPSRAVWRRARSAQSSKTESGKATSLHKPLSLCC